MKSYTFKMKMLPANILCLFIYISLFIISVLINVEFYDNNWSPVLVITGIIIYFSIHELLHGLGYVLGGAKSKNIKYGVALERGILYTLCREEITKKNILISLCMPFLVIGVITYIIGAILELKFLVLLSICNLAGATMDLVMFIYIASINKVHYSETDACDEFVLITDKDLSKRKNIFFKIVNKKEYNKKDFIFKNKVPKFTISRISIYIIIILIVFTLISTII